MQCLIQFNLFKKIKQLRKIKELPAQVAWFVSLRVRLLLACLIGFVSSYAFASNADPFPSVTLSGSSGNIVKAVGSNMETSMQYALLGGGVIMLLAGIGVIMHRLREDSANNETGSFIVTLIIAGLAITVGIILIAIGWKAATYQPTTS